MTTVYVETAFIVGHARREHGAASLELMNLARKGEVALVIPVLCLFEALFEWRGRKQEIIGHQNLLGLVANDLQPRAAGAKLEPDHERLLDALREAPATMTSLIANERSALDDAIDALAAEAKVLPLTSDHFRKARELERKGLKPADALIAASILLDAEQMEGEKLFLVQDGDFSAPPLRPDFKRAGVDTMGPLATLLLRLSRTRS